MNIFKKETNIKFINKKYYLFAVSSLVILAGLFTFFKKGLRLGIDFSGGTLVEASFKTKTTVNDVRSLLDKVKMGDAQITRIGTENKFFIKTLTVSGKKMEEETMEDHAVIANRIKTALLIEEERRRIRWGKI